MKNIMISLLMMYLLGCSGKRPAKTGLEGKPLPSFNLLLMDSTTNFNTSSIPSGKTVILFYFTPSCPFCRALTREIISNIQSFANVQFYILTPYPFQQLKNYYNHYQLNKYANITVGRDYNFYFGNYFKPKGVPYMAVYTKDKKLKGILMGKVSVEELKDVTIN